jgi:DNA-binding CsgD family transcriptional regulator
MSVVGSPAGWPGSEFARCLPYLPGMSRERYAKPNRGQLTPRQQDVLKLLAAGKTNREIGEALGMTLDGAKFHVSEVIAKLGVATREEAAEWWRAERGIGSRSADAIHGLFGIGVLKWATVPVAAAVGIVAVFGALNGGASEPDPKEHPGWVAGDRDDGVLWLRGAGWPVGIETAVEAQHIIVGTVEAISEGRPGAGMFVIHRIGTVRVDEVIATRGDSLPASVPILIPGGTFDGRSFDVSDVGPDFRVGDKVLLFLQPPTLDSLAAGTWMSWLDQRIYYTRDIPNSPGSLPLETVIEEIRARRD